MHLFSRGKNPRLDNFVVLLTKKNFRAKNGRKMAYFLIDCRCTPELAAESAPPGVWQNRRKTKVFAKTETHLKFLWARPAILRNFNSIHALVWSERPTEICQNLRKFHPCDLRSKLILVELQIGISQRLMHLFSRGKKPRLDNFVVFLTKKNFQAKNGRKMAYFSLDCRCTPELAAKSAPPGVGQNRGKKKFFAKNETHLKILWALPASLRNFNSIHALVWSERPT